MVFLIISCKEKNDKTYRERELAKEWKKHLQPQDSIINIIKEGKTFALESNETQGIDHERWKEFDYWKEMDKSFFENKGEKKFSNPDEDGGTETTLEIFKAIKKGETEIRFYKRRYYSPGNPANDTVAVKDTNAYLYSTYKFRIE